MVQNYSILSSLLKWWIKLLIESVIKYHVLSDVPKHTAWRQHFYHSFEILAYLNFRNTYTDAHTHFLGATSLLPERIRKKISRNRSFRKREENFISRYRIIRRNIFDVCTSSRSCVRPMVSLSHRCSLTFLRKLYNVRENDNEFRIDKIHRKHPSPAISMPKILVPAWLMYSWKI